MTDRKEKPATITCGRAALLFHITLLVVITALIFGPMFYRRLRQPGSDFGMHLTFTQQAIQEGRWPPHLLYHLAVAVLSGFTECRSHLGICSMVILGVALLARLLLSAHILGGTTSQGLTRLADKVRTSENTLVTALTFSLLLCSPIANFWQKTHYMGQISPNVWESPTWIFAQPFQLLAFAVLLREPSGRLASSVGAGGILLLAALAKPNYLLAVLPAWLAVSAARGMFRNGRMLGSAAWLAGVAAATLAMQYHVAFGSASPPLASYQIVVAPFRVWRYWSACIPASLVVSLAFPAVYVAVFRKYVRDRPALTLAWLATGFALFWMAAFAEQSRLTGELSPAFNFSWGAHFAASVLFLYTLRDLLAQNDGRWRALVAWGAYAAHLLSGVGWLGKQLCGLDYH